MRARPLVLCVAVAVAMAFLPACGRFGREQDADGGADASSADDGGSGGRACSAKLCVDFDDPAIGPPWGFDDVHATAPDSLGMVPGLSPPNALSIKGTVNAPTFLRHDLPSTATLVRMSIAVRLDEVASATVAWLVQLRCAASGGYNYLIKLQNGQIVLKSEAAGAVSTIASPTPGSWMPLELVAALTSTSTNVTAKAGDTSGTISGGACAPESIRIASSELDSGYVRISVDDVVLDWN